MRGDDDGTHPDRMSGWSLDDIDWRAFDPACVDPGILAVVKTAALVEANAPDYVSYLRGVFAGDDVFIAALEAWGAEEAQHGAALGRWAQRADPGFDLASALDRFRTGYPIDVNATASIRGSRAGELVARQVVETGTSSFYSALRDATGEPVLKAILGRIVADEFAHYRLFQRYFACYQVAEALPVSGRLRVAATRFAEAENDELGWAWFAANVLPGDPCAVYRSGVHSRAYAARTLKLYRRPHIENGVRMLLRAVALRPNGPLFRLLSGALWRATQVRAALV